MAEKKAARNLKPQRQNNSSLADFIERPVPSEQEVAGFERVVKQELHDQEIDSNLSEIYRDRRGELIDVKTLKIKRGRSGPARFFRKLLGLVFLVALAYGVYYFINQRQDQSSVDLKITTPDKVDVGQAFSYQITYRNTGRFSLNKISLNLQYPDNFIFLESTPAPTDKSNWQLPDLAPGADYTLEVKGQLINKTEAPNIINAQLVYTPANFSSEFKQSASANTLTADLGFDVETTYLNTALIGQIGEADLDFKNFNEHLNFDNFFLEIAAPSNIAITDVQLASSTATSLAPLSSISPVALSLTLNKLSGNEWQISQVASSSLPQRLAVKYKVTDKTDDRQTIVLKLEQRTPDGRNLVFWEKSLDLDILKSDLSLILNVNGVTADQAVDFGQTLNYSLAYANHGASVLKDVNIRLDLQGAFFDWESLQDVNKGQIGNDSILWTKDQIPELAEVAPNQSGEIKLKVKVKDYGPSDLGQALSLSSQARFNLSSGASDDSKSSDRQSNLIINKINSNFQLSEQIRYFDENNIPVGSGPLPPKVANQTSVRVYWTITNSLHELSDAQVSVVLPAYVNFAEKSNVDTGSLIYDNAKHQVTWAIGRLPVSVKTARATFDISLTPTSADLDKILVLSPGATANALDIETQGQITRHSEAKTTKLEDDDIANLNNSGQVSQ